MEKYKTCFYDLASYELWNLISQGFLPVHSSFTSTCISNTISDLLAFRHAFSFVWWQVMCLSNSSFLLSPLQCDFSCIPDFCNREEASVLKPKFARSPLKQSCQNIVIVGLFLWLPTRLYTWKQELFFISFVPCTW